MEPQATEWTQTPSLGKVQHYAQHFNWLMCGIVYYFHKLLQNISEVTANVFLGKN